MNRGQVNDKINDIMKLNEYIEITNEDNMELMARYPDKYFDLALVDPPYGINAPNMAATPCQRRNNNKRLNGGSGKLKYRKLNTANCDWDNAVPTDEYFTELKRISKNQVIWGGNYFNLPPSRCILCWDKVQPWENFSQVELAWTSFDSPAQLYRYDNRTGDKIHPTQKPVALYAWILKKYAKQGDKILDTHFGSGSIACAVHKANIIDKMDLSLVACELDKDYFESSIQRVKEALQTQSLF